MQSAQTFALALTLALATLLPQPALAHHEGPDPACPTASPADPVGGNCDAPGGE